ncbi:MAG: hypothetical protein QMD71_08010 [bacterium]|nr:hypothetical protein [bacterium]
MCGLVIFVLLGARPLSTDDAYVDRGKFELEFGYEFKEHICEFSLKPGITERLDFAIALPYLIKPQQEIGIAGICIKYSLLDEGSKIASISVSFGSELGADKYALNGVMSKK